MADELTDAVLEGKYYYHPKSKTFRPGIHPDPPLADPVITVDLVTGFLKRLYSHQEEFLQGTRIGGRPHYEHLFHLSRQLSLVAVGRIDDASAWDFVQRVARTLPHPIMGVDDLQNVSWIAKLATEYIQCVAWHELTTDTMPVGFDLLREVVESTRARVTFITLNHDLLLERILVEYGVDFVDGFGPVDGDVRWYDPPRLSRRSRIRVLKPHGSINWFGIGTPAKPWQMGIPAPYGRTPFGIHDGSGTKLVLYEPRPLILTGQAKEMIYTAGIFSDMIVALDRALEEAETIVMSGFSWNDVGMSNKLSTWLERDRHRRIILLATELKSILGSRGMNGARYGILRGRGQVIHVDKYLCDTTLDDIRDFVT